MKQTKFKKITSIFLATTLMVSILLSHGDTVFAGGDTLPARSGEPGFQGKNQPSQHGYCKQNLLDWTPEMDADYEFMRAKVPLQERNEAFTATQANPLLDQKVQNLILAGDYGNGFFNSYQCNDQFAQYLFNFWQYTDYAASWHGMVTDPAPDSLFNPEAGWWQREYEFGVLNLPNPAYTNAAHKNGVKALGCIFFPRSEHTDDYVYKDANGKFPLADKLVEMAKYYGFDGYFLNAEEDLPANFMPVYEEFVKAITSQGIYVQVYASNKYGQNNQSSWGSIDYYNKDATQFSNWIKQPDKPQAASSLYMNPDPSKSQVDGSVAIMKSLRLDPKKTVFNTLEAGQTGFSGTRGSLYNTYDENLVPRTSIASLGSDSVWSGLDETLFGHSGNNSYNDNRRGDPAYQKYVVARERTWWSGAADSPNYTDAKSDPEILSKVLAATPDPVATSNNPARATATAWPGLSAFISERSVIHGGNFYTNFNTGHGMQYFVDGKVSNNNEWSNINIQDILPTWQWWIDTPKKAGSEEKSNRLKVDFDYGKAYKAPFDYEQLGGYNGGSSLVVKGDLNGENFVRLYKTNLDVKKASKASITYNKPVKNDGTEMKLGLIFKDAPTEVKYLTIPGSNQKTSGWVTKELNLGAYAGKEIATIGLLFKPNQGVLKGVENEYQINIGEIKITDGQNITPNAPTELKIDKAFNTSELYISWKLADYKDVQKYNVYAEYEDGKEIYLGGTYDDSYYIKSLYNPTGNVKIKVTAVSANGAESAPDVVKKKYSSMISNITVQENIGNFNIAWQNPNIEYTSIKASVKLNYSHDDNSYTKTVSKGTTATSMTIPIADGSKYTLRLSLLAANGKEISYVDYTGQLKDSYSNIYEGKAILNGSNVKLTGPTSRDWWHLYASENGKTITFKDGQQYAIRGVDDLTKLAVQGTSGVIKVILEDYAGNKSAPVMVPYGSTP